MVSYDGYPINVKTRPSLDGKDTNHLIKDNIKNYLNIIIIHLLNQL